MNLLFLEGASFEIPKITGRPQEEISKLQWSAQSHGREIIEKVGT